MMKNFKRGFTLIELLVVIAIIGILAAIVLASLGTARSKGSDAKVKEQLGSVRNAAEIYYSSNKNYGPATVVAQNCTSAATMGADTSSGMAALMLAANVANWPGSVAPLCVTNASGSATATGYAAWHIMSDGSFWCVDSTGASKSEPAGFTVPSVATPTCQ